MTFLEAQKGKKGNKRKIKTKCLQSLTLGRLLCQDPEADMGDSLGNLGN